MSGSSGSSETAETRDTAELQQHGSKIVDGGGKRLKQIGTEEDINLWAKEKGNLDENEVESDTDIHKKTRDRKKKRKAGPTVSALQENQVATVFLLPKVSDEEVEGNIMTPEWTENGFDSEDKIERQEQKSKKRKGDAVSERPIGNTENEEGETIKVTKPSEEHDNEDHKADSELGEGIVIDPQPLTASQWWKVDLTSNHQTRGATMLVKRCMKTNHWNEGHARRVLEGYKVFLESKKFTRDWNATKLSPSLPVDSMWHAHVLDTQSYSRDCELLVGDFVHHDPNGGDDNESRLMRVSNMKSLLIARLGVDYDNRIWDFGEDIEQHTAPKDNEQHTAPEATAVAMESEIHDDSSRDVVIVGIRDQEGESTFFRTRRSTKLSVLFHAFAQFEGISLSTLRFYVNGIPCGYEDTLASLDIEDGDEFDVMREQRGC